MEMDIMTLIAYFFVAVVALCILLLVLRVSITSEVFFTVCGVAVTIIFFVNLLVNTGAAENYLLMEQLLHSGTGGGEIDTGFR